LVLAVCACAASTHREKHAAVRTPRRAMPVMCGQEHVLANCTPIRLRLQICTRSCSNKHRDTWRVFTGNLKFASEVLFLQAHRRETETHFTALELECHRKLEPTTPSRKHSGDSSARHSTTA
jgi:hypothetical protein